MKNILTALAIVLTVTLSSCGGQTLAGADNDSDSVAYHDTIVIEEPVVTSAMKQADKMVSDLNVLLTNNDSVKIAARMEEAKLYVQHLKSYKTTYALDAYREKINEFAKSYKSKLGKLTYDHKPLGEIIDESINR